MSELAKDGLLAVPVLCLLDLPASATADVQRRLGMDDYTYIRIITYGFDILATAVRLDI